jgi:hypothetical protein
MWAGVFSSELQMLSTASTWFAADAMLVAAGDQLVKVLQQAHCRSSSSDPQQQLLGWFSYRPGSPCSPSMREAAVCRKLQEWRANNNSSSSSSRQQPVVFGLFTSQPDHNSATVSLQYKFYKVRNARSTDSSSAAAWTSSSGGYSSSSSSSRHAKQGPEHPLLQPLDLAVHNLGAGHAATAAAAASTGLSGNSSSSSNKWGSASLPALEAVLRSQSGGSAVLSQQQVQQLQEAAAMQAGAALATVQGLYDSLLDELQVATAQVRPAAYISLQCHSMMH